jgi:hypothetical protein
VCGGRSWHREKTKLLHHAQVVTIREVLDDFAVAHLEHVDVLNLK